MNNKNLPNFLMFVKCIQNALPVDVPIIKISYLWISRHRLRLNGIESAFRFISPNSISPNFKSPMHSVDMQAAPAHY